MCCGNDGKTIVRTVLVSKPKEPVVVQTIRVSKPKADDVDKNRA